MGRRVSEAVYPSADLIPGEGQLLPEKIVDEYADNFERRVRGYLFPSNFCKLGSDHGITEQANIIQGIPKLRS